MGDQRDHRFFAVPWFESADEYHRYLHAVGGFEVDETFYPEFVAQATALFIRNKADANCTARKVVVTAEELTAFCEKKRIPLDEEALDIFVNHKFSPWIDTIGRNPKKRATRTIAGYAWFDSREEYDKCAAAAAATGTSRDWETYDEWKATAEKDFRRHQSAGRHTTVKVPINADEFVRFCRRTNRKINVQSRIAFIRTKLAEKYDDKIF